MTLITQSFTESIEPYQTNVLIVFSFKCHAVPRSKPHPHIGITIAT